MKAENIIKKMHRKYAGDTKYPATGTDKYQMYLDIINDLKEKWARDPNTKWSSCWEERDLGTVTEASEDVAALTVDLENDVNDLSDFVYLIKEDGQQLEYTVIKEKDRRGQLGSVFLSGRNPKQLTFTDIPAEFIGATVQAGIYAVPPDVKRGSDIVPVDNPMWVIFAGAAELSFNDPVKEDNFADLNGFAQDEWNNMIDAADNLPGNQPNGVPTVGFPQIGGDC